MQLHSLHKNGSLFGHFLRKTKENVTKVGGDRQYDSYWLSVLSFFFCASICFTFASFHLLPHTHCFLGLAHSRVKIKWQARCDREKPVVGEWLHWISLLFGTDCKLLWWPILVTRQSCRLCISMQGKRHLIPSMEINRFWSFSVNKYVKIFHVFYSIMNCKF